MYLVQLRIAPQNPKTPELKLELIMGFVFSKLYSVLSRQEKQFKIVIVGLQNAGKTTILYKL